MSERLRILVVPKWYPWPEQPVLGAFCREHARALATRHDVVVMPTLATPSPPFRSFAIDDAVEEGLRTVRVRYRRPFARPAALGFQTAGLLTALGRLRRAGWVPDVVHAHVYQAGLPALALGRRAHAPVVVTEHYTGFQRGLVTGYERLLARTALQRADLVAPVSEDLAGHLRALAPGARMRVLPNTVDTAVFHPAATVADRGGAAEDAPGEASGEKRPHGGRNSPQATTRAGDTAPRPPRLLTVGSLAEKKGQRYAVDALALLDTGETAGATLDIVGGGPLQGPLAEQAARLGLGDRVRLRGELPKEEIAELMRASDAFVLPSTDETFGCVLIEALACGLPVVATAVGGVPEVVRDGEGTLVPPRDAAALAEGIATALADAGDGRRGEIARAVAGRYGYGPFADGWTEVYDELLAARAGRRR
ncbi:MAG: glycosyltransferase family 4 protein [Solirubrobacterales bacterium]|nr:glycosyltransferase family 4 protein [Solirubrobacterales bacterium]